MKTALHGRWKGCWDRGWTGADEYRHGWVIWIFGENGFGCWSPSRWAIADFKPLLTHRWRTEGRPPSGRGAGGESAERIDVALSIVWRTTAQIRFPSSLSISIKRFMGEPILWDSALGDLSFEGERLGIGGSSSVGIDKEARVSAFSPLHPPSRRGVNKRANHRKDALSIIRRTIPQTRFPHNQLFKGQSPCERPRESLARLFRHFSFPPRHSTPNDGRQLVRPVDDGPGAGGDKLLAGAKAPGDAHAVDAGVAGGVDIYLCIAHVQAAG